jgi:hypothetical protein
LRTVPGFLPGRDDLRDEVGNVARLDLVNMTLAEKWQRQLE